MRRLRAFLALSAAEQNLLLRAAALVAAVRAGLTLLRFPATRALAAAAARPRTPAVPPPSPEAIAGAVAAAGAVVPAATCLTQALAAKVLLGQSGYPGSVVIGVARGPHGQIEAHAWVELDGRVLLGGPREALARYTALPPLADD